MVISASQSRESATDSMTERTFALGLGLTNECNLACSFCYRDPTRVDRLSFEQVRAVMKSLPVRSVNLGTGENGLHPEFTSLVDYLRSEPIKLTITSNGYSIEALDDAAVTAFHDIEFSLDYPTQAEQDRQRGPGNWRLIHEQAARCRELGLSVTFIAVIMRSNFDRLAEIPQSSKHTTRLCASMLISRYVATLSTSRTTSIGGGLRHCLRVPMRLRSGSRWCARWRACRRGAAAAAWRPCG